MRTVTHDHYLASRPLRTDSRFVETKGASTDSMEGYLELQYSTDKKRLSQGRLMYELLVRFFLIL